jgi:prevent-host-death family protein
MKFVSIREFRNNTAAIRKALAEEHEIVLTANGKPVALVAEVDEDSFEERLQQLRRSRDLALLRRIRAHARETGASKLTMAQINEEIAKARRERRARE